MTTKPLPATVDVGPFRYTVITDELAILRAGEEAQAKLFGEADHAKLTITLDMKRPPGVVRETIVHELCHVLFVLSGLHHEWGTEKEEEVVQRLSPWLLELLRRNPTLVDYLLDDE